MYEKLGMYLLVVFGCAVLWGLYAITEVWGWRLGLVAAGVLLFLLMWWAYRAAKFAQSVREAGDRAAREFREREKSAREQLTGMEALDQYLERSSAEEAKTRREEEVRRERLLSLWAEVEPQVMAAIECVNRTLGEHRSGMHLGVSEGEFVGRDDGALGVSWKVVGENHWGMMGSSQWSSMTRSCL